MLGGYLERGIAGELERGITRVSFYYADGSADHLVARRRCDRPRRARRD